MISGSGLNKVFWFLEDMVANYQLALVCPVDSRRVGFLVDISSKPDSFCSVYGVRYRDDGSVGSFCAIQRLIVGVSDVLCIGWGKCDEKSRKCGWRFCSNADGLAVMFEMFGRTNFEAILLDSHQTFSATELTSKFGEHAPRTSGVGLYHPIPYHFDISTCNSWTAQKIAELLAELPATEPIPKLVYNPNDIMAPTILMPMVMNNQYFYPYPDNSYSLPCLSGQTGPANAYIGIRSNESYSTALADRTVSSVTQPPPMAYFMPTRAMLKEWAIISRTNLLEILRIDAAIPLADLVNTYMVVMNIPDNWDAHWIPAISTQNGYVDYIPPNLHSLRTYARSCQKDALMHIMNSVKSTISKNTLTKLEFRAKRISTVQFESIFKN